MNTTREEPPTRAIEFGPKELEAAVARLSLNGESKGVRDQEVSKSYTEVLELISHDLSSLTECDDFTLHHFKKCWELFGNVVLLLITRVEGCSVPGKLFPQLNSSFYRFLRHAKPLGYTNYTLLQKMACCITVLGLKNADDKVLFLNQTCITLEENKTMIMDVFKSDNYPLKCYGILEISNRIAFTGEIDDLDSVLTAAFGPEIDAFMVTATQSFPSLLHCIELLNEVSIADSINYLLSFQNEDKFHRELVCGVVGESPQTVQRLETLKANQESGGKIESLLHNVAIDSLKFGIPTSFSHKYFDANCIQLANGKDQFPDICFKVIHEVLDLNFQICLSKEPKLINLLQLSLQVIYDRLQIDSDFIAFHDKACCSKLSVNALMSSLNFILAANILFSDIFAGCDSTFIPEALHKSFPFKNIPPLSRLLFISDEDSDKIEGDISNQITALINSHQIVCKLQAKLRHYLTFAHSNLELNSSLAFKFLALDMDMRIADNLVLEILHTNISTHQSKNTSAEPYDYDLYFLDKILVDSIEKSLQAIVNVGQEMAVKMILNTAFETSSQDLRLVGPCSNLLERSLRIDAFARAVRCNNACEEELSSFVEVFDDLQSDSFTRLREMAPRKLGRNIQTVSLQSISLTTFVGELSSEPDQKFRDQQSYPFFVTPMPAKNSIDRASAAFEAGKTTFQGVYSRRVEMSKESADLDNRLRQDSHRTIQSVTRPQVISRQGTSDRDSAAAVASSRGRNDADVLLPRQISDLGRGGVSNTVYPNANPYYPTQNDVGGGNQLFSGFDHAVANNNYVRLQSQSNHDAARAPNTSRAKSVHVDQFELA